MSKELYDESFYEAQMDGSYKSALLYARHLINIYHPKSVVDLGCGRGMWLKAFGELGATRLIGLDGSWNDQTKMVDSKIIFKSTNLNCPLDYESERYDLAMSVEVAEHLKQESSETFIKNLTLLSDVVLFGAAFIHQGGTDHINEQPHTYWANIFITLGYQPYDLFRPTFWGHPDVEFWYQQNTFLYVKKTSSINEIPFKA